MHHLLQLTPGLVIAPCAIYRCLVEEYFLYVNSFARSSISLARSSIPCHSVSAGTSCIVPLSSYHIYSTQRSWRLHYCIQLSAINTPLSYYLSQLTNRVQSSRRLEAVVVGVILGLTYLRRLSIHCLYCIVECQSTKTGSQHSIVASAHATVSVSLCHSQ
jgi:hypothetical protein